MKTVIYRQDLRAMAKDININQVTEHDIPDQNVAKKSDVVIFVDVQTDQFKILKYNGAEEFTNVIIDGLENLENFI